MARTPHEKASREDLSQRLLEDRATRFQQASLHQALFSKTLAYFTAITKQGCGVPPFETTIFNEEEIRVREARLLQAERVQRGHPTKHKCNGRIKFNYDREECQIWQGKQADFAFLEQ